MDDYTSYSTNQFGLNFINNLPASQDNVVFSPWSIINLLGMVLLGATDKSKSHQELHKVLSLPEKLPSDQAPEPHEHFLRAYKRILASLQTKEALENKTVLFEQGNLILYNKDEATLKNNYVKQVQHYYLAGIQDFRPGQPDSRGPLHERINKWVSNITHGMINDMAEPSMSTNKELILALLNADYFSGKWQHVFERTKMADFYNNGREQEAKTVEFVRHKRDYEYAEFDIPRPAWMKDFYNLGNEPPTPEEISRDHLTKGLECRVLVLPYLLNEGKDFSMILLLPHKLDGVDELQRKLNSTVLNAIYQSVRVEDAEVEIPKFSFESKLDAKQILISMGMQSIFKPSSDLSGIFEKPLGTTITKVLHKAKISVDEAGAIAASSTLMEIMPMSAAMRQITFYANHPFLFIIRHNPTNMPLFMGRVNKL